MTDLTSIAVVVGATFVGAVVAHAITASAAKSRRTREIAYARFLARKNHIELLTCAHMLADTRLISRGALAEIEREYGLELIEVGEK